MRVSNLARFVLFVSLVGLLLAFKGEPARAEDGEGEIKRETTIIVSYTRYKWWLLRWSDNSILCSFYTNHEGLPTGDEIYTSCGKSVYNEWSVTPACLVDQSGSPNGCIGLYLHLVSTEPAERSILVELPAPKVWIKLKDCQPTSPDNRCNQVPTLTLTGEEPLPNEQIIAIYVTLNGQTTRCSGNTCDVPLQPTRVEGTLIDFWAESSFGDTSEHFKALIRIVDSGVSTSPTGGGWYVDVLSSQWTGNPTASCAQLWDAFPPIGGPPAWLLTPEISTLLETSEPYYYLAGRLIAQELVQASDCPNGGLLPNGYANACGLEKAMPLVKEWQNSFDQQIIATAKETGVPAQLLKNVFAQESQFWPGAFKDPKEFGLGQITDNGAETILLWNSNFFYQFCPLVLDDQKCAKGYVYLDSESQALLRGALAAQARSECPNCQGGIDLNHANFSISLFANTLLANCSQVSRIVYNATNRSPGEVSTYEDLWRFTIANYHIGPGCLSYAIYNTWSRHEDLDWEHVASHLTPACQSVIPYVENVSK